VAPRNEIEQTMATIWRELLGIDDIGIHDNFFELRGHSLMATQLAARLRDVFMVEVPLRSFFESPTIASLSDIVEQLFLEKIETLSEEEARRLAGDTESSA
jgi:acyl carrier protein